MYKLNCESIVEVSSRAEHSAFCDLLLFKGVLIACYRQATNHVSDDGRIETVVISAQGKLQHRQRIQFPQVDLRDPKLSIMPNGKILLFAYARHSATETRKRFTQAVCWSSENGQTWSSARYFGPKNWWLWRLTWQDDKAYGFAYNRNQQRIDLYGGLPYSNFDCIVKGALSRDKHGFGYPNESDIYFDKKGTLHALVRRDADSYSALYGTSSFPYTRFSWHDLGCYIGGPKWIALETNATTNAYKSPVQFLVGGRSIEKRKLKTLIWHFDSEKKQLKSLLTLPSAGDNSYPGLVMQNSTLYALYYSSHIDNISRVYLAKMALVQT